MALSLLQSKIITIQVTICIVYYKTQFKSVNKFIISCKVYYTTTCVISIIIDTPSSLDLTSVFVTTADLLCQCIIVNK